MKNKKEILAIVGMCGSGKSVVSDYFRYKGYKLLRFGQITLDEAKQKLEANPSLKLADLEKKIRERNRKEHGMAAYAILNKHKIDELSLLGNVVIDGLYSWAEYKYLKDSYGDKLKVLAVVAPPEIRYSRLENRLIVDPDMRNRPISKIDAKLRDYAEIENIEKGGPIAMADIFVKNDGPVEDLIKQLDNLFYGR